MKYAGAMAMVGVLSACLNSSAGGPGWVTVAGIFIAGAWFGDFCKEFLNWISTPKE